MGLIPFFGPKWNKFEAILDNSSSNDQTDSTNMLPRTVSCNSGLCNFSSSCPKQYCYSVVCIAVAGRERFRRAERDENFTPRAISPLLSRFEAGIFSNSR